ncbi:MAG: hypothetical protein KDD56_03860 [Bdellovibrionales bacterium]|nr:hypothetical protein [Bdellovibrionales bacterium]
MSNHDINELFSQAADAGAIPVDSLAALTDLSSEIQNNLGVSAEDIPASEVFLLTMEIDDSSSIRMSGNSQHVRDGHNFMIEVLAESNKGDDMLVHTTYLNGGTLFPFVLLKNATRLDARNFNPSGCTPLYDRTVATLGTVLAKEQEFANQGVPVRTITLVVTDGEEYGSRKYDSDDVKKLVEQMLASENHIVAFMGIDDGKTDFRAVALAMGIPDQWILTPKNDGSSIREAFGIASRAAKSASQGAGSFSSTAIGGFDAGIS